MCLPDSALLLNIKLRNNRILDSLHMIFTIVEFWHYLIDSFGDYNALLELHWYVPLFSRLSLGLITCIQVVFSKLSIQYGCRYDLIHDISCRF